VKSEYFVKLQRAMEAITSGTADGKVNENALMERVKGTIQRCAELSPIIGMWLALSLWGAFMKLLQSRGKRKSKRKSGKKKKRKINNKKSDVADDKDGKESTQRKSDEDATKEDEKIAPPSPSSDDDDDDDDDEDGDSSSGEEDDGDDDGDDEDDDALPHVGPSFVGASVLSNIYGGQRRRPSAKGRASAGLRTSEPRTVGGRRIQTPIVMPTRTDNNTTTNPENNVSSSDKKEN